MKIGISRRFKKLSVFFGPEMLLGTTTDKNVFSNWNIFRIFSEHVMPWDYTRQKITQQHFNKSWIKTTFFFQNPW